MNTKTVKQFLHRVVFVLLICTLMAGAFSAYAEETTPQFTVTSASGKPGEEVTVQLVVENNPGILNATLTINYDPALTLVNVEKGDALSSLVLTKPGKFEDGCNFLWDAMEEADTSNGTILNLTFRLPENATNGQTYQVGFSYIYGDIADNNLNPIEFQMNPGTIQVREYTYGDVNDDGRINGTDVTLVRRHIAGGWNVTIITDAADVNNDSRINGTDVTLIRRYIAGGWGVELPVGQKCTHTNMTATPEKAATCTEDGNTAYWYCTACKKYFADAQGKVETTLAATVIPTTGHGILSATPEKAPTCTEPGHIAYWYCGTCNKYFKDAEGKTEITLADTVLNATGHTYSNSWTYNNEYHWHAATCEHSDLIQDQNTHTYGSDKICTVCSFNNSAAYKLAAPQDVAVAYDKITWKDVPNAYSYTVEVTGGYSLVVTNDNMCDLSKVKNTDGKTLAENEKYKQVSVTVYANNNGEYTRSDASAPVQYYYVANVGEKQSADMSLADSYGLGLGYNMVEQGFYTGMKPGQAVFNTGKLLAIDKLTQPDHIGSGGVSYAYYYTSVDDYLEQRTNSLSFTADAGIKENKFFTTGLKANLTYGDTDKYSTHKFFASYINRTDVISGILQFNGQNTDWEIHCLSENFLRDIRRESSETKQLSDADLYEYLYNKYGTHAALGVKKGGYFESSYLTWTDSDTDLQTIKLAFEAALNGKLGTFFDVKLDANAQGEHTIQTTHQSTVSTLSTSFYGGTISGVSSGKDYVTDWSLGNKPSVLCFTDNGAIAIASLLTKYEAIYGNLGLNGEKLGIGYQNYIDDRATDLYHELYDQYTYKAPFDVEVQEEDGKNILVIDLSMYQADGELDAAGCSYFTDGIFTVYPNMLGKNIDAIRLIGAMDQTNTNKELLEGFSLALKGKWTKDVEIILENFGVETRSEYGIVDSTKIPKNTKVSIRYEGINIVKDTQGIYSCYIDHKNCVCSLVISDQGVDTWDFGNVCIDGDTICLPMASKANYTFTGWFDAADNQVADKLGNLDVAHQFATNESIKANWKPNTYTITLNQAGANTQGTEKIYLMYEVGYAATEPNSTEFDELTKITIPTRTGYVFEGYYTLEDVDINKVAVPGKVQYIDANGIINNVISDGNGGTISRNMAFKDDVVLYAQWRAAGYTVAYNANGGSGTVASTKHTYDTSTPIAANNFTCTGKSFTGWNTKQDGSGIAIKAGATDYAALTTQDGSTITLYAQWTDNIKITFSAGTGISNAYTTTLYMLPGGNTFYTDVDCKNKFTLDRFTVPALEGYTFLGYYDSVSNNRTPAPQTGKQYITLSDTKVVLASGITSESFSDKSRTLTAAWELKAYTATWSACANGTITVNRKTSWWSGASIGNISSGATVYYGDNLEVTYKPNTGYKITGNGDKSISVKSNITASNIWAKTEALKYKITYNLNTATANTSSTSTQCYETLSFSNVSQTVTYDQAYSLDVPQASYYIFKGWYTASSGGTQVANAEGKFSGVWKGLSDITVYAQWSKKYTDYTYIKTPTDFANIKNNLGGKYMLIQDINIGNTVLGVFTGTFNGNGHTLTGWNYCMASLSNTGNLKDLGLHEYGIPSDLNPSYKALGIFKTNKGTITNLKVSNAQVCNESDHDHDIHGGYIVAVLCGMNYGTISDITVSSSKLYVDVGSLDDDSYNAILTGFICGYNKGTVKNCTANNNSYIKVYIGSKYQNANAYVGGISGYSAGGSIVNCKAQSITISATAKGNEDINFWGNCKAHGRPRLYVGGIIGCAVSTSYSSLSVSGNKIESTVSRDCDCGTNMEHKRGDTVGKSI